MEKLHVIHRILIGIVLWGNTGCSSKAQQMEHPETKAAAEIVAVRFEKWKKGEADFFGLLADDVVWTVSGKSPVSGTYHGKTDFLERAVNPIIGRLKTPLKPELISLTADSFFVWLHFSARATTKTDEIYENTYIWKMQLTDNKITNCIAFLDTYELTDLMNNKEKTMNQTIAETKEYIGMWVTKDGYIRHELLPNNRYDEARGNRKSAYQGSYKVTGNHIDYKDDTGFSADGEFKDGVLYHAGMILYKEK
ncbi:Atu4866 domain-containing protein [Parapedobacter sp. ISTM3]|uniref:Atu4866 domain-containing protein n=1 Tax=Parapedobacter sp. ISTM3 TaxID=2800130 RepID=UPI001F34398A|nr:Atu4866 domain-containing protein [Parapedobacter sp. ISTM3]